MVRCNKVIILHTEDEKWDYYVRLLPLELQDIYYFRKYHQLYEKKGYMAELFVYIEGEDIGIYPYMKTEVNRPYLEKRYYDIETVYGYGGPLANNKTEGFIRRFEKEFDEYCETNDIVAEFVRFHPVIKNEHLFNEINVIHNRKTVLLDVSKEVDDIWMNQVSTQNRNIIRKCYKNGLCVEQSTDYDEFKKIYEETMNKVGADDFYYFDTNYYKKMSVSSDFYLLGVKYDNKYIAMGIFMQCGEYFHYHLAGSRKEYLKLSPNNLLLWEAIKYANKNGSHYMHFGGGLTDSEEDSLFRFKSKYSKESLDFYIGKKIIKKDIYDLLIDEWEKLHQRKASILLQYKEK